jgi:hypothetical protein
MAVMPHVTLQERRRLLLLLLLLRMFGKTWNGGQLVA